MIILCLFRKNNSNTEYIGFVAPFYEGDNIHEVDVTLLKDVAEIASHTKIFTDYKEAHKYAHLETMSLEDYEELYRQKLNYELIAQVTGNDPVIAKQILRELESHLSSDQITEINEKVQKTFEEMSETPTDDALTLKLFS